MKYLLVVLAFPFFSPSECGNKKKEEAKQDIAMPVDTVQMPSCIQKMINEEDKKDPLERIWKIAQYLYNAKTVYLVTANCCDHYNTLYDDSCKVVCAPTGGFTGRGDGKCPDFSATAKHVKVVYTKPD